MEAPAVEVRNDNRRISFDPATGQWSIEQDGQVFQSTDKSTIEARLDLMDQV